MGFQKAKREKIYPKIALIGPSGAGKSYTALRLASGYVSKLDGNKKIYYIDSEGGRGKYYADKFDYEYCEIKEPYSPEKYIQIIDEALSCDDCGAIIVDSTSHEWSGKGGILEQHSNMPGNSYTNWSKLTPRHNRFIDKILYAPVCIITTVRGKDAYVLEDKNGKQVPKKVGVGGEQRGNFEYEMTVAFNIDQNSHVATASKDNTGLFDNKYNVLTEDDGKNIYDWANSGEAPAKKPEVVKPKPDKQEFDVDSASLDELHTVLMTLCKEKAKVNRKALSNALTGIEGKNPNNITDINIAKETYKKLIVIE
ncbi:MAG: AAA family ATPase [Candidatus Pacebacteria bacterium]|nr:AAA family ATPase [Candidatus Paceibacterota bacterium]